MPQARSAAPALAAITGLFSGDEQRARRYLEGRVRVLAAKAIAGARGMDEIESMAADKRGDPGERQLAWSRYYHEYRMAMNALADLTDKEQARELLGNGFD